MMWREDQRDLHGVLLGPSTGGLLAKKTPCDAGRACGTAKTAQEAEPAVGGGFGI